MSEEPDGGFPVYILDDDTIIYDIQDVNHVDYWRDIVSVVFSKKYNITRSDIIDLPYSQRRARVVGNNFYCGERITKKLIKKIEKTLNRKLNYIYDEHETRCEFETSKLKSHINNNISIS
jgi:hypothetical protein